MKVAVFKISGPRSFDKLFGIRIRLTVRRRPFNLQCLVLFLN